MFVDTECDPCDRKGGEVRCENWCVVPVCVVCDDGVDVGNTGKTSGPGRWSSGAACVSFSSYVGVSRS